MNTNPDPPSSLIDSAESARRLGISVRSFERIVSRGKIAKIYVGTRAVRYSPDEIAKFVENRTKKA